nr:hydantoinase B/oxoprolinase family protein [Actibacterium sp. 188UL27-1]
MDKKGISCPLVYTKAYACYALKVAIAPEIPNNADSLTPFEVVAPENSIVHAMHPAPVALRHIVRHFVPDAVYDAFDKILSRQKGRVVMAFPGGAGMVTPPNALMTRSNPTLRAAIFQPTSPKWRTPLQTERPSDAKTPPNTAVIQP